MSIVSRGFRRRVGNSSTDTANRGDPGREQPYRVAEAAAVSPRLQWQVAEVRESALVYSAGAQARQRCSGFS